MLFFGRSHGAQNTFARGGIHPNDRKELTGDAPIEPFRATSVTVHLSQSLGSPSRSLVSKDALVRRGQLIASDDGGGMPVHAPISGIVRSVDKAPHPSQVVGEAIVIEAKEVPGGDMEFADDAEWASRDRDTVLERIKAAGVVGLGGAVFPTYRKLMLPPDAKVDTLIINGSECEPYLTCDYRLMLEDPESVVMGAWIMARTIGVGRCLIGIEDNKRQAADALAAAIERLGVAKMSHPVDMSVAVTATKYPQGSEKQLIQALTGRLVPARKLPLHIGVVVQNVATAHACYQAVRYQAPVIERIVTVSGAGVAQPKNLRVPLGTSVADLLAHCGGIKGDVVKVLAGGPMMGRTIADMNVPVTKGIGGLLFLTRAETSLDGYQSCIGCGECLDACPLGLEPNRVSQYVEAGRPMETERFGPIECFECGCCSYVCPSYRPLVQFMQLAKTAFRRDAARRPT